ncbi:DUF3054 domain-containing protein [Hazenella coriacea]|uniref:DUF3054 family protein n=1 Tax=Hazenella coriacea TaxID=1179467 RepID=A0A4R3L7X6_9BACL|nr:DUF3054 domain-containing protein [Hazenella coriacea]TCS95090.1 DUF3054 family protein [Hazenella coriacea]
MRLFNSTHTKWLLLGDLLILLIFSWLGRVTHEMPVDMGIVLWTTFPFAITWLLVAPTLGIYSTTSLESKRQMFFRTSGTVFISITLSIWFRSILTQHPFHWLFYVVTLLALLPLFLIWRVTYTWIYQRVHATHNPSTN